MNRQNDTKTMIMVFSLLSPFVIWLALIVAGAYEKGIKIFELIERLTLALNNPFNISFNEYSVK